MLANYWGTFAAKFITKNFQKSPNFVTLIVCSADIFVYVDFNVCFVGKVVYVPSVSTSMSCLVLRLSMFHFRAFFSNNQ